MEKVEINEHSKCFKFFIFKGTVSVISSDPPWKDGNARFTTVPLKPKSDQKCGRYRCFFCLKSVYFCKFFYYFM